MKLTAKKSTIKLCMNKNKTSNLPWQTSNLPTMSNDKQPSDDEQATSNNDEQPTFWWWTMMTMSNLPRWWATFLVDGKRKTSLLEKIPKTMPKQHKKGKDKKKQQSTFWQNKKQQSTTGWPKSKTENKKRRINLAINTKKERRQEATINLPTTQKSIINLLDEQKAKWKNKQPSDPSNDQRPTFDNLRC